MMVMVKERFIVEGPFYTLEEMRKLTEVEANAKADIQREKPR